MRRLAAPVLALVLAACAGTEIVSQWSDPALASVPFRKILVVFQNPDAGLRRGLEDEMARRIPRATPAYRVIADAEIRDVEKVKSKVRELGFDSVVVMRIVSVEKEQTYVPGTMHMVPSPYGRMYGGYWGYGWASVHEPGYLRTDRIVTLGTNVYAVADDRLVWATRSETYNPESMLKLVNDVVARNAEAARKAIGKEK